MSLPARACWVALLLLAACSRPAGTEQSPERSPSATAATEGPASAGEAPSGTGGPVLTPEDVEAETEHRITEQNLESELDRLEREIQAE